MSLVLRVPTLLSGGDGRALRQIADAQKRLDVVRETLADPATETAIRQFTSEAVIRGTATRIPADEAPRAFAEARKLVAAAPESMANGTDRDHIVQIGKSFRAHNPRHRGQISDEVEHLRVGFRGPKTSPVTTRDRLPESEIAGRKDVLLRARRNVLDAVPPMARELEGARAYLEPLAERTAIRRGAIALGGASAVGAGVAGARLLGE